MNGIMMVFCPTGEQHTAIKVKFGMESDCFTAVCQMMGTITLQHLRQCGQQLEKYEEGNFTQRS